LSDALDAVRTAFMFAQSGDSRGVRAKAVTRFSDRRSTHAFGKLLKNKESASLTRRESLALRASNRKMLALFRLLAVYPSPKYRFPPER
jgi:hypothetical protein